MGRAVAIQLAKKGANVAVVARTTEKLQLVVESINVSLPASALDALDSFTFSRRLHPTRASRDFTTLVPI